MSALLNSPKNLNFLAQNNFLYEIDKCPGVAYFCNEAEIPDISVSHVRQQSMFANIPQPADSISFGQLSMNFLVDEDLENYFQMVDWLYGIGGPASFKNRKDFLDKFQGKIHSTINLLIFDAQKKPHFSVRYFDCIPTTLSRLLLATDSGTVNYLTCTASFQYSYFEYEKLYSYGESEVLEHKSENR